MGSVGSLISEASDGAAELPTNIAELKANTVTILDVANPMLTTVPEEFKGNDIPETEELGAKTKAGIDTMNELMNNIKANLATLEAGCMSCIPGAAQGAAKELKGQMIQKAVDATDFGPVDDAAKYIADMATGLKALQALIDTAKGLSRG